VTTDWASLSDAQLWSRASGERDGEAFGELFARHMDAVCCYTVASLSAGPQSCTSIAMASPVNSGRPGQVTDALGTCSSLWSQGLIKAGPRGAAVPASRPSPDAHDPVPPLVVCVMPDGTAAVFPGDKSTCAALGLPDASG
jgi:hypothetical protein